MARTLPSGAKTSPATPVGAFSLPDLFARVRLAEMDSLVGAESQVFPVLAKGDRRHGGAFRGLDLAGFLARGQVPEFHGALDCLRVSFGGRGRQRLAVWSESEPRRFQAAPAQAAQDEHGFVSLPFTHWWLDLLDFLAGSGRPQEQCAVGRARRQGLAVGRENDAHQQVAALDLPKFLTRGHVPELDHAAAGGGQRLAVGRQGHAERIGASSPHHHEPENVEIDLGSLFLGQPCADFPVELGSGGFGPGEAADFLTRGQVPQADGVVLAGRDQRLAVRRESDVRDVGGMAQAGCP